MRTKAGFSLDSRVVADLDALAFVRRTTKSELVEDGVLAAIASLTPEERTAFEHARAARSGSPRGK